MRRPPLGALALLGLGAALLGGWASGAAPAAAPEESVQLKAGEGRDLTTGRCILCHSLEYIPANAPAMDRAAWQKTVQKMRERFGAPITDGEAKEIVDYLSANYAEKS
jgi:sulfite dehydrogenase (cytochrome) subunit B